MDRLIREVVSACDVRVGDLLELGDLRRYVLDVETTADGTAVYLRDIAVAMAPGVRITVQR
ncbi:hypothetical protein [Streptomyces buecherae]|uniref:Uncharacterized protein n=1 Tax=Streptomyces buecherae TaxID=2763006 RepID=A0A7H8NBE5_9ACTN|nr:hypothetical protein [Streptomyces buecherae]QKW51676.1 hypothetical protein HUT08_21535 [Streptomyces buecherae]